MVKANSASQRVISSSLKNLVKRERKKSRGGGIFDWQVKGRRLKVTDVGFERIRE